MGFGNMSNKGKKLSGNHSKTIIRVMWWSLACFMAFLLILSMLIYNGVIGYMPPVEELMHPRDRYATTIYTSDGVEMGKFYRSKGNRSYVDFEQMSPHLKDALVATEDVRFEQHSGIDVRAIFRSLIKRVILGKHSAGGGSTITQQLAKQLYSPEASGLFARALQKPIEWAIAIKIERFYTKDEIVKMYFNQFDFLNNAVGISSASWVYFGKKPKDLNVQEAATLVGMCKNPSYYNPFRFPERVKERRNVVFDQMYKAGMLTSESCAALKATPLILNEHKVETHEDGIAPYFREELHRILMADEPDSTKYSNINAYNADKYNWDNNPVYGWCKKNKRKDGRNYDIYSDGLKIYTTVDSRMQQMAEAAVSEHMMEAQKRFFQNECGGKFTDPYTRNPDEMSKATKERVINMAIRSTERYRAMKAEGKTHDEIMKAFDEKVEMRVFDYNAPDHEIVRVMSPRDSIMYMKTFLRCGMVAMDPRNGKVKAYVGGPDFKHFKYDMVSTGTRQIGSTAKPFVFSLAMQNGFTPCSTDFENSTRGFGKWQPKGGSHGLGLHPQLRDALAVSSNWVPPQILLRLGAPALVDALHNDFGITSKLDTTLTLALGSCEISLLEMVSAYAAFANYGQRPLPLMVSRNCDNRGNVIAEFFPKLNQAISAESSYRMVEMLRGVVTRGTGRRLGTYNFKGDVCGKTGTTNYNADAWWVGFTPEIVCGVWFGGEDRYIHFQSTGEGQGAAAALPIFGKFLRKVYNSKELPYDENAKFIVPSDFKMCEDKIYDNEGGVVYEHSGDGDGEDGDGPHPDPAVAAEDQSAVNDMFN